MLKSLHPHFAITCEKSLSIYCQISTVDPVIDSNFRSEIFQKHEKWFVNSVVLCTVFSTGLHTFQVLIIMFRIFRSSIFSQYLQWTALRSIANSLRTRRRISTIRNKIKLTCSTQCNRQTDHLLALQVWDVIFWGFVFCRERKKFCMRKKECMKENQNANLTRKWMKSSLVYVLNS